jgi:four helix bundle protein
VPLEKITSYRDLLVWQRAMDLVVASYRLTQHLPSREIYGLASQIQRASVSIAANIAEGHGRSLGDYLHHLSMAGGSLRELETHVLIAQRLSYVSHADAAAVFDMTQQIGRMLATLEPKLKTRRLAMRNAKHVAAKPGFADP